jgi:hypothetical protein
VRSNGFCDFKQGLIPLGHRFAGRWRLMIHRRSVWPIDQQ